MDTLIKIGVIGDFNGEFPPHKATNEALKHCAEYLDTDIEIKWLPQNNFFVSTLFVPQLNSSPEIPHKLIIEFLKSAKEFHLLKK